MSAECSVCRGEISPLAKKCPHCLTDFRQGEGYVIGGATGNSDIDRLIDILVKPGIYLLILMFPIGLVLDYLNAPFWLGVTLAVILGCYLLANREKLPDF